MPNLVYWASVFFVRAFYWDGKLLGRENLPGDEPGIFVANHTAASGPIGCYCSLPFELHGWLQAEMADPKLAEDYIRVDFVEKTLRLRPPVSHRVAHWLVKIAHPYLQAIRCITVYPDYDGFQITLQTTVDRLKRGNHVVIFPEDPRLPNDPVYNMAPFRKGMVRVAELYYEQTGKRAALYPVAVHPSKTVRVGKPIQYSPLRQPSAERMRIKNYLEARVRALYLQSDSDLPVDLPLPEA
jgi:1-acyl-sn-glycerol-3-phosphate acyltransferase